MAKVHSVTTSPQPPPKGKVKHIMKRGDDDDDNDDDDEPPEEWDTVVIGSGIGGLAVASLLSQLSDDKRILVVDQHPEHLGGSCHSFDEEGYPFGAGIHLIGDVGEGDHAKKLMDALTLSEDPIEWTRYPDEYESIWIGNDDENDPKNRLRSYNMVANRQREALMEQFPDEEKSIGSTVTEGTLSQGILPFFLR